MNDGETGLGEELVKAIRYLQDKMPVELLWAMHHRRVWLEHYPGTLRYFQKRHNLRKKNLAFARRVIDVANAHSNHGGEFKELVREACLRYPEFLSRPESALWIQRSVPGGDPTAPSES